MGQNFSFGIEEEYFLVDAETKAIISAMPEPFLKAAKKAAGQGRRDQENCGQRNCGQGNRGQVTSEMLQAQIEVATSPHTDMTAAREELRRLRRTLAEVAARARACDPRRRHASDRVVA